MRYLHEFDRYGSRGKLEIDGNRKCRFVQCPTWGYPTEGAYCESNLIPSRFSYSLTRVDRDASSIDVLLAVKIPLFALNAEDDPVAYPQSLSSTL